MELSSLTFTAPASRPLSFFNAHRINQFQPLPSSIPSAIATSTSPISPTSCSIGGGRRGRFMPAPSKAIPCRPTGTSPLPLPRFCPDSKNLTPPICFSVSESSSSALRISSITESRFSGITYNLEFLSIILDFRYVDGQIDDMSADFVISQLLLLDAEDPTKDIRLLINSPGGSVTAGMGIYDAMKQCKADVSTVTMGLVASMGAFLLAAGTKGKRFAFPNSRVMIHQPLGAAGGKATEMSIRVKEMVYHKIKINKILSRITGKPESQIEMDTDRDYFMGPWEAKDYGLVDAVIDDGKPELVATLTDLSPPPKSKVWHFWKAEGTKKAKKNIPSEHKFLQKSET